MMSRKMHRRSLLSALIAASVVFSAPCPILSEMISTSEALELERATSGTARAEAVVDSFLAREDVASKLASLGVDPELARLRADALSDAELVDLAGRIEKMPAGGTSVIGVLGVTFLVLLVLELVGVIDIFKKL